MHADKPFIDLNCAALQDTLLESELFGYEAGAFSGARTRKLAFELADGGTLFLDEIMEMPAQLQSKLLRALRHALLSCRRRKEGRGRCPIGSRDQPRSSSGRSRRHFPFDLLYRVNSFEVSIAPLRERREDIEPLAQHLLQKIASPNPPILTQPVIEALSEFSWSGNVRQLRNCLERATLLADNGRITVKELPPEIVHKIDTAGSSVSFGSNDPNSLRGFHNASPVNLRDSEKQQIINALERTGWHRGKTAELLGISPSTLYRRLREYDLETR